MLNVSRGFLSRVVRLVVVTIYQPAAIHGRSLPNRKSELRQAFVNKAENLFLQLTPIVERSF